jgi:hypothetical protein
MKLSAVAFGFAGLILTTGACKTTSSKVQFEEQQKPLSAVYFEGTPTKYRNPAGSCGLKLEMPKSKNGGYDVKITIDLSVA